MRSLAVLISAALVLGPIGARPARADDELARGIRLVEDGDYDEGILILDAVARSLVGFSDRTQELSQAYLYLGIAYVGKGYEAAAKTNFREVLARIKDFSLSPDKYPPKVINVFESTRQELNREQAPGPTPTPRPSPPPTKGNSGGGGKALWIVGGAVAVAGGVALAASGGSGGSTATTNPGGLKTTTFQNQVVVFGGGRDFAIDVTGSGTLTARVDWQQDAVLLAMYVVNLANPTVVLASAGQTGAKQLSLSQGVAPGSYRVAVTNSTGAGPHVDTTFTLTVTHP